MELTLNQITQVGLGYASQADAFQRGREAAQMAKSQLPEGPPTFVLAFGPASPHFQAFIEGVRLVTGEETLVGIPGRRVVLSGLQSPDAAAVAIFQASSSHFSLTAIPAEQESPLQLSTKLFNALRGGRGQIRHQFDHHGMLIFDTSGQNSSATAREIAATAGMESWIMQSSVKLSKNNSLVCQNNYVRQGLIAVEVLSNNPWAVGTMNIGSFLNQPDIYARAIKSVLRDTVAQTDQKSFAFGLIVTDMDLSDVPMHDVGETLNSCSHIVKNIAVVSVAAQKQFARVSNLSVDIGKESITALLVPE